MQPNDSSDQEWRKQNQKYLAKLRKNMEWHMSSPSHHIWTFQEGKSMLLGII